MIKIINANESLRDRVDFGSVTFSVELLGIEVFVTEGRRMAASETGKE
jgi:hypothetical protein